MPERFEQLVRRKITKKVSKLKEIFKKKFTLIHDKDVVIELTTLIDYNTKYLHPKKRFNQIRSKQKIY